MVLPQRCHGPLHILFILDPPQGTSIKIDIAEHDIKILTSNQLVENLQLNLEFSIISNHQVNIPTNINLSSDFQFMQTTTTVAFAGHVGQVLTFPPRSYITLKVRSLAHSNDPIDVRITNDAYVSTLKVSILNW